MTANKPHERRVGDTTRVYSAILTYKDTDGVDTAKDVTGLSIAFTMINSADGTEKVAAASADIVDAANGIVSYTFLAADVDTPGIYWGSFIVTESAADDTYPAAPCEGPIWIHGAYQTAQEAYDAAVAV